MQSVKRECLDHFIDFGETHLRYLLDQYLAHDLREWPHQGLGNLRIGATKPPEIAEGVKPADLVCHDWLGGLLKHYKAESGVGLIHCRLLRSRCAPIL